MSPPNNRQPSIVFITAGDPRRLTGGYLYHARVFAGLRARGMLIDELVASGADLVEQRAAADHFAASFSPQAYDAILIDALARGVCAPWIERWRAQRPVIVLVHQLPSEAEAEPAQIEAEHALEAPLLQADRLIAVSMYGRAALLARGVPPERIAVISPGFDRLSPDHVPREPSQPEGTVRALCVAQWIPRKGITTLIEAWAAGRWSNATLELVGETDADARYAARVRAALASAGGTDIAVRGTITDDALRAAYRAADLFGLPSRFEGYGMAYAEALAYGLPVVACEVGPIPALISPAAGLLVPPDDPAALTIALDRLIRDPSLRRRLAIGARRRAETLPRWDDAVDGFAQLLEQVTRRAFH
jgi:glycosyltransferase involved in cell wall biosynthesis